MELIKEATKPKLIVDFDGTIVWSISAIVECYNEDFKYYRGYTPINACDISTYEFKELSLADKTYIDWLWGAPRFFRKLDFMDNAEAVLQILKSKFDIYIATKGRQPNLTGKKLWIYEYLPFVKGLYLIDTEMFPDKSHIDMSHAIFVDDESKTLRNTNAEHKILFGDVYEWNKDWKSKRCYNWYEILKTLETYF